MVINNDSQILAKFYFLKNLYAIQFKRKHLNVIIKIEKVEYRAISKYLLYLNGLKFANL